MKGQILFIIFLITTTSQALAQAVCSLVGTARSISSTCYQITPAADGQTGAVWLNEQVLLTKSFELNFSLNFGSNPNGADGIALVFQTLGQQVLGGAGRGMGYALLKPSLAVEFDTNYNSEEGDIVEDHIALVQNGIIDHRFNKQFKAPVPISPVKKSVKDGFNHSVKVSWNVTNKLFRVDVDCVTRISQVIDPITDLFTGVSNVNWGFTASTGSGNNSHTVCLQQNKNKIDTILACRNDIILLSSSLSQNEKYQWSPTNGFDNPQSPTPHLTVDSSRLYVVRYMGSCDKEFSDSIYVHVKTPVLSITGKRNICAGDTAVLTSILTPDLPATYAWSNGQKTAAMQPSVSGLYSLTVDSNGCYASDTVSVKINSPPILTLPANVTYDCPAGQSILLDPKASGSELKYSWTPTLTNQPTLDVNTPGIYEVKITSSNMCPVTQQFEVLDNCLPMQVFVPDAFTPNEDGINDTFKWFSESVTNASMKLFNRWGELLFSSSESNPYWNGTYKGNSCPADVYTWRLDYKLSSLGSQQLFSLQGKVLLIK